MAQVINTNILSQVVQNNLNTSQSKLSTAIERLSSGLRINSAKDDAAGMAIANRFQANITGLTQASRNANDGISLSQITESAVSKINERVQNIRRLTEQALNGTNSSADRNSLQDEINQDLEEINRIAEQTGFNGIKVLSKDQTITLQVGAKDGEVLELSLKELNTRSLGLDGFNVVDGLDESKLKLVTKTVVVGQNEISAETVKDNATNPNAQFLRLVKVESEDGSEDYFVQCKAGAYHYAELIDNRKLSWDSSCRSAGVDLHGKYLVEVKKLDITIPRSDVNMGEGNELKSHRNADGSVSYFIKEADGKHFAIDISKEGKVKKGTEQRVGVSVTENPLAKLDAALSQIDGLRSTLGAMHSRFESVISNLESTATNLLAAQSRIQDTDYARDAGYAQEVAKMGASKITVQSGVAVLVQANQVPQLVLSLLR